MGAGDVKLAIGLGALTGAFGPDVWMLAALGAPVLTALLAMGQLAFGAGSSVPHGPSMCLATWSGSGGRGVLTAVPAVAVFRAATVSWENGTRVAMDHCR